MTLTKYKNTREIERNSKLPKMFNKWMVEQGVKRTAKNKHCYKRWEVVEIHVRLKRNDESKKLDPRYMQRSY